MEKELISREAVITVLKGYWKQYTQQPIAALIAFIFPALGNILVFFVPPLFLAKIINELTLNGLNSTHTIGVLILSLGGIWLLGEGCWRIGMLGLVRVEEQGMNKLYKYVYKKLVERDYDFYINNFVGSLVKKGSAYARNFESFTDILSFNIVTNLLPIIFAIVILWRYSPIIPIVLIVCMFITVCIAIPIIRSRAKLVAARHDAASQLSGRMSDTFTNIFAIKSFAQEKEEGKTFGTYVDTYTKRFRVAADYQNTRFEAGLSPVYVFTNVVGIAMAAYFTVTLGLAVGTMVIVFSYYSQITRIFWDISHIYRGIESSVSESAEFVQLVLNEPTIVDAPGAKKLEVTDSSISFNDVGFAYETKRKQKFMEGLTLHIKGNEKIGLVGPSGGGKTTITKLVLRFIDVNTGSITIDGQDIKKVTQESLREAISYVPQEPLMFHRTLYENIAYGKEGATKKEVVAAAKLAHAHEFIEKLPHGYDTLVGERGVKLSGGQRQRVAIARALVRNALILVLDEATSALDSESEKYIQEGLWELMKDKTAIVIAHRLSTIKHLDRIIVLDDGKIVQDGTHDDLIKQEGLYAKLWSHQTGEMLEV